MNSHPAEAATRENGSRCRSCDQPLGAYHHNPCDYGNLTSPYVIEGQCTISTHQQQGAWRSPETAPKDGRAILLSWTDGRVCEGSYLDNSKRNPPWQGLVPRSMFSTRPGVKINGWMPMPADALSRAPQPDTVTSWQPIETAPRDETRFIFRNGSGFVGIGRFVHKTAFAADSWGGLQDTIATNWMPLPEQK